MPIQSPSGLVQLPTAMPPQVAKRFSRPAWLVDPVCIKPLQPPTALQADDHERDQARDDDEELQHLVVDGTRQPAEE